MTSCNGWIKCSDRMPDDGVYVLVATVRRAWVETHFVEECNINNRKMWFSANPEADLRPLSTFTHWRPLPEPPGESGTKDWIKCSERMPGCINGSKWSKDVRALSDTGEVFILACFGDYWQRTKEFIKSGSTKITHWMPMEEGEFMTSREKFEAKCRNGLINGGLAKHENGKYASELTDAVWRGWQASRESIEVDIPKPEPDSGSDSQVDINAGFSNRMRARCIEALRAAGLKP